MFHNTSENILEVKERKTHKVTIMLTTKMNTGELLLATSQKMALLKKI
jgi:hypothetical protein